jgi:hypothetical protein
MIRFWTRQPHILVACQPKSGSTFLSNALASLLDIKRVRLVPGADRREQELSELRLRHYRWRGYVAQLHLRRSKPTEALIDAHRIQVVVLVRNLFDIVVSWRDHMRNENPIGAMAYFTEEHAKLPDEVLEKAIAKLFIPWNINFYMSWRDYPDALLVRYEDMIASPEDTLRAIAQKAHRTVSDAAIQNSIEAALGRRVRFNVGVAGRGEALSRETRQDIIDLLAYYPEAASDPYVRDMTQRSI